MWNLLFKILPFKVVMELRRALIKMGFKLKPLFSSNDIERHTYESSYFYRMMTLSNGLHELMKIYPHAAISESEVWNAIQQRIYDENDDSTYVKPEIRKLTDKYVLSQQPATEMYKELVSGDIPEDIDLRLVATDLLVERHRKLDHATALVEEWKENEKDN